MRHPGEEFRVYWTEEEGQRYEAEGLVSVIEWDPKPGDAKPRRGAVPTASEDVPVDAVLYRRVERLENALSDVLRTVSELSLIRLSAEEVEAIRVALGTAADVVDRVDSVDVTVEVEPPAVAASVRDLIDREDEGLDLQAHLAELKVDDLRAIGNDMEIPNLHGKMTKATLIGLIVAGLDEQRKRYAARTAWEDTQAGDGAIVRDGQPVVPAGGSS